MGSGRAHDPTPEAPLDWEALRGHVRRCVRAQLGHVQPDDLEEICQLALVRVLRVRDRSGLRNPVGLATVAAERAAKDWLRARRRWRLRFEPLEGAGTHADPRREPGAPLGDPLERVRFVVTEYFEAHHAPCAELARPYFQSRDWSQVAAATGRSHDAVRKQWSRCTELLRRALRADLAPLFAALRDGEP